MNNEAREADAFADFRGGRNLGELSARSAFRAGWDAALALPVSGVTDNTALIAEARGRADNLSDAGAQWRRDVDLLERLADALESQQGNTTQGGRG